MFSPLCSNVVKEGVNEIEKTIKDKNGAANTALSKIADLTASIATEVSKFDESLQTQLLDEVEKMSAMKQEVSTSNAKLGEMVQTSEDKLTNWGKASLDTLKTHGSELTAMNEKLGVESANFVSSMKNNIEDNLKMIKEAEGRLGEMIVDCEGKRKSVMKELDVAIENLDEVSEGSEERTANS